MTQEDKELLLKDLCARLPYDVKVNCNDKVYNLNSIQYFNICVLTDDNNDNAFTTTGIKYVKSYLFPLSSMTEEQSKIYHKLIGGMFDTSALINFEALETFFHKYHLDYRCLIPMGLAIDATGKNIY